jgi:hypothetical protein
LKSAHQALLKALDKASVLFSRFGGTAAPALLCQRS